MNLKTGIYRHYKGGLYFVDAYATNVRKELPDGVTDEGVVATAKYEPTMEDVDVHLIFDSNESETYYMYHHDRIFGSMVFYRGLDQQCWLRPLEVFHGDVKLYDFKTNEAYSMPRFEPVEGEYLFDSISELIKGI